VKKCGRWRRQLEKRWTELCVEEVKRTCHEVWFNRHSCKNMTSSSSSSSSCMLMITRTLLKEETKDENRNTVATKAESTGWYTG